MLCIFILAMTIRGYCTVPGVLLRKHLALAELGQGGQAAKQPVSGVVVYLLETVLIFLDIH
jgi:hypothetical protein